MECLADYGGAILQQPVPLGASYQQISISGIHVTTGTFTIRFYAEGSNGAWVRFDDVTISASDGGGIQYQTLTPTFVPDTVSPLAPTLTTTPEVTSTAAPRVAIRSAALAVDSSFNPNDHQIPVDPPWVAQKIGRKPWMWPCSWDSPFNLPISTVVSYQPVPYLDETWMSASSVYYGNTGDSAQLFIRDGQGQKQNDTIAQLQASQVAPTPPQLWSLDPNSEGTLIASSHLTPDYYGQNLPTPIVGPVSTQTRPLRAGGTTPYFSLPPYAVPYSLPGTNTNNFMDVVQPDGMVVESAQTIRVSTSSNGLVAGAASVWDGRSDCTPAQNGLHKTRIPSLAGLIRDGEITNGIIPHALSGIATQGLSNAIAISPSGTLLAIPSNVDLSQLGLSPQGLVIAHALQDYGYYIVDVGDDGTGFNGGVGLSVQLSADAKDMQDWLANPTTNFNSGQDELTSLFNILGIVVGNPTQQSDPYFNELRRAPYAPDKWYTNQGNPNTLEPPQSVGAFPISNQNGLYITWVEPTDASRIVRYDVYRGGTLVGVVPANQGDGGEFTFQDTSYVNNPVVPLTDYDYRIMAEDSSRNQSPFSGPITVHSEASSVQVFNGSFADNLGSWKLTYATPNPAPEIIQTPDIDTNVAPVAVLHNGNKIEQAAAVATGSMYKISGEFSAPNNANSYLEVDNCNSAGCEALSPLTITSDSSWSAYSSTFTATSNSILIRIVNANMDGADLPVYANNIRLEYFNPPTNTPTPTPTNTPTITRTPTSTFVPIPTSGTPYPPNSMDIIVNTVYDFVEGDPADVCYEGPNYFCSLRTALRIVGPGGTIEFSTGCLLGVPYNPNDTPTPTSPCNLSDIPSISIDHEIDINKSVFIKNPRSTKIRLGIDDQYRFFHIIGPNVKVQLDNFQFVGGNDLTENGTAIENEGGWVVLTNTDFLQNHAGSYGGAIDNEGGRVDITHATFDQNTAVNAGGAIYNSSGSILTILDATFSNNKVTTSTRQYISGGGAIFNLGQITLTNATIAKNDSGVNDGGGIYNGSGYTRRASLTNVTIAQNTPDGLLCAGPDNVGILNSIVLDEAGSCPFGNNSSGNNFTYGDPKLGPLASVAGSDMQVMVPLLGSPVIDQGQNTVCAKSPEFNLDQLGHSRLVGATCDLGAVESTQTNLVVNTVSDDGDGTCVTLCTLRDAIALSSPNGTITFASTLSDPANSSQITCSVAPHCTIGLKSTLYIRKNGLKIEGLGHANLVLSGQQNQTVIQIDSYLISIPTLQPAPFAISDLTIANGLCGLAVYDGKVTIENVVFDNNNNSYSDYLGFPQGAGGAILVNGPGEVIVDNSTFTNNKAYFNGGAISSDGVLTITNSTFFNNTALNGDGGAIYDYAYLSQGQMTISNSTFFENQAATAGGAVGVFYGASAQITNSTIKENQAVLGGGLFVPNLLASTFSIKNTILDENIISTGTQSSGNCAAVIDSPFWQSLDNVEYNVLPQDTPSCGAGFQQGDPGLATTPDYNGGPTKNFALTSSTGLAVGKGDPSTCLALSPSNSDQRGYSRPHCDIGADSFQGQQTFCMGQTGVPTALVHYITGGVWKVRCTPTSGDPDFTLNFPPAAASSAADIPVVGDWTGQGTRTIGVFNPSTGWNVTNDNFGGSTFTSTYGTSTHGAVLPIVGNWNNDITHLTQQGQSAGVDAGNRKQNVRRQHTVWI